MAPSLVIPRQTTFVRPSSSIPSSMSSAKSTSSRRRLSELGERAAGALLKRRESAERELARERRSTSSPSLDGSDDLDSL